MDLSVRRCCATLLIAILMCPLGAWADSPSNPNDIESVALESYALYFVVVDLVRQCKSSAPEYKESFDKSFTAWDERNMRDRAFVESALAQLWVNRTEELKQISESAPSLFGQSGLSMPQNSCISSLDKTLNIFKLEDYSVKLSTHLKLLAEKLGHSRVP